MRFVDYALVVARRWWVIAVLVIACAGSAFFLSRAQDPIYRATQLVLFEASRSDNGLLLASRTLLEPAVVYLYSSQIAQRVIDTLELDMEAQALLGSVNIASDDLRLVVQIDVDHGVPEVAQSVAAAWGQVLVDYRAELNQRARREERVSAILPDTPTVSQIAPNLLINVGAASILGLILGALLVFGLEFLESSVVRRCDDLERGHNLPVLATVTADE